MGVLKLMEPLNSISHKMDGSNLHPCSIRVSVELKITLCVRNPSDRVSFPSRESSCVDFSLCYDFLGLDGRPMLNSTKRDQIFSSMRLSKTSNLALMASSDAMALASRSVMLRSLFYCRVSGMKSFGEELAGWMANKARNLSSMRDSNASNLASIEPRDAITCASRSKIPMSLSYYWIHPLDISTNEKVHVQLMIAWDHRITMPHSPDTTTTDREIQDNAGL
ncbi:hypothetical protein B296_00007097 [Ensete ventricosum]|uniref:Uncharacterized protein n=1 Tax=Ensete ventricosum TaxID=4639 RepID=A0A426ZRT7_ENSVE|nr:hypothetical protein B296_00007097 [Ensete ventricosum]